MALASSQVKQMTTDLLGEIQHEVPDDAELEAAAFGIRFLPAAYVFKWYKRFIMPHRAQVQARDVEFFKSMACTSDNSEVNLVFGIIARLWPMLSDEVRKKVWVRLLVVIQMIGRAGT